MTAPHISVIMPVYNCESYVGAALQSVLRQTYGDLEVIAVDDGSTDATADRIANMVANDSRIRLVRQENGGVSLARNTGLAQSSGDLVGFIDADDLWVPERLARQVAFMEQHADIACVIGHCQLFSGATENLEPVVMRADFRRVEPLVGAAIFRREAIEAVGGFDDSMAFAEDIDLYFQMLEAGLKIHVELGTSYYYRRHDTNVTNDKERLQYGLLHAIQRSMKRRREAGQAGPIDMFFCQHFDEARTVGG